VALELMKRGHTITWVAPYEDKELQANANMNLISMETNAELLLNSTAIFEGKVFLDFFGFVRTAVEVNMYI